MEILITLDPVSSRRQDVEIPRQSTRVRFPDQDDDQLLLDVVPFPEERLALQQQVRRDVLINYNFVL